MIRKVKGVKGLKILLKDVASSASAGKHSNKLIGSASIPLKVWLLINAQNVIPRLCNPKTTAI
jgi:hypothetical protein